MDIKDIVNEADKAFVNGNISSLSKSKLLEYIQALSCFNAISSTDQLKKSTCAQSLNTLYNIKVMEEFNKKNTRLTYIVIILAAFSFVSSGIQIYLSF